MDPPAAVDLAINVLEPAQDIAIVGGAAIAFVCAAVDPDSCAEIDLVLDADENLATVTDQFAVATLLASGTRSQARLDITLPSAVDPGTYSLFATIRDGMRAPAVGKASGRVVVSLPPGSLTLHFEQPATETVVARGGSVALAFTLTGVGPTAVRVVADVDGLAATSADQFELFAAAPLPGRTNATAPTAGIPVGTYRILGIATQGGQSAVAEALGRLRLEDVAFAIAEGGSSFEEGLAIAAFADRSLLVAGRFSGLAPFGDWPQIVQLDSTGDDDVFFCRYSPTGTLQWAKRAGGPSSGDWAESAATYADGSFLLGGYFHGLASFNGGAAVNGMQSAGENDAFVAKYSGNGTLVWARRAGGVFNDRVTGVATFADGSCVVAGTFAAQATFGTPPNQTALLVSGSPITADGFLARYDADGALVWVKQFGGPHGDDAALAVASAADGSCSIAGTFVESATFGEGAQQVTLLATGGRDAFVARFAGDGTLQWARRGGGFENDTANGIASLADGGCVVTGAFRGIATFGNGTPMSIAQSIGGSDVFVARFAPDGTIAWLRTAGGNQDDEGNGVSTFADGSIASTGTFQGMAVFATTPSPINLTAAGARDAFVARHAPDGTLVWANSGGSVGSDVANAVVCLDDGSCAITGALLGDAVFGANSDPHVLPLAGWGDAFVVRCNADGGL